jgi:hypothetical protein
MPVVMTDVSHDTASALGQETCAHQEGKLCQTCITALICLKGTLLTLVRRQEPISCWGAAPAPVVTNCPTA